MQNSFLYVISSSPNGPVKLGFSNDPERRLHQLQTGHAERLILYHQENVSIDNVRIYEKLLHKQIGYKRKIGEWFDLTVEQAIAEISLVFIDYEQSDLIP